MSIHTFGSAGVPTPLYVRSNPIAGLQTLLAEVGVCVRTEENYDNVDRTMKKNNGEEEEEEEELIN